MSFSLPRLLAVISVLVGVLAVCVAALYAAHARIRRLYLMLGEALYEARHDHLTGLLNRRGIMAALSTGPDVVAVMDLDGFKNINDRYGHHVGDEVLMAVAQRLRTAMGSQGLVARTGGDEFILLWPVSPPDPIVAARAVLKQVTSELILAGGQRLIPSASLGLARRGAHLQGDGLLAAADHAMYHVKPALRELPAQAVPAPDVRVHLYTDPLPPPPGDRRSVRGRVSRAGRRS